MIRKFLIALLSFTCVLGCACGLAACAPEKAPTDAPQDTDDDRIYVDDNGTLSSYLELELNADNNGYTVKSIGEEQGPNITIPEKFNGLPVTAIESFAFSGNTEITGITISKSVTSIGDGAFSGCTGLRSFEIPGTVKKIGSGIFENCSSLASVTFGNVTVSEIPNNMFRKCSKLASVKIPTSVAVIKARAFEDCSSLKTISLTIYTKTIEDNAFLRCSALTELNNINGITTIGNHAFEGCSALKKVSLPRSVTKIGFGAFYHCSNLESIEIPFVGKSAITDYNKNGTKKRYETIADENSSKAEDYETSNFGYIFGSRTSTDNNSTPDGSGNPQHDFIPQSLKNVKITGGQTIADRAFLYCYFLETIEIGDGSKDNEIKYIGESAFGYCDNLQTIIIGKNVTKIFSSMFGYSHAFPLIYYKGTTRQQWEAIEIKKEESAHNEWANDKIYYYSDKKPSASGNYWHYNDDGKPVEWE